MLLRKSVIITGGGVGKRMNASIPKQFLELNGKPILMHTIVRFYAVDPDMEIIVVLPADQIEFWKNLCIKHEFAIDHKIVAGGVERFHSVKNGLKEVTGDLIAVHDAVRPLTDRNVIRRCFDSAELNGSGIPTVPLTDSIRELNAGGSKQVNRANYQLVQTPQCFQKSLITRAYTVEFNPIFTDDASVVEASGVEIHLVNGDPSNIKITNPLDLEVAELIIKSSNKE